MRDEAGLLEMETALRDFYPMPELVGQPPGSVLPPAVLSNPDYRWLLGLVDGEPVGTAMAHRKAHSVHVEWITSDPTRRGKGYGEAMTWEATPRVARPPRDAHRQRRRSPDVRADGLPVGPAA